MLLPLRMIYVLFCFFLSLDVLGCFFFTHYLQPLFTGRAGLLTLYPAFTSNVPGGFVDACVNRLHDDDDVNLHPSDFKMQN